MNLNELRVRSERRLFPVAMVEGALITGAALVAIALLSHGIDLRSISRLTWIRGLFLTALGSLAANEIKGSRYRQQHRQLYPQILQRVLRHELAMGHHEESLPIRFESGNVNWFRSMVSELRNERKEALVAFLSSYNNQEGTDAIRSRAEKLVSRIRNREEIADQWANESGIERLPGRAIRAYLEAYYVKHIQVDD